MDIALQLLESGNGAAGIGRVVHQLNESRKTMTTTEWRVFAKWAVTHQIVRYLHADPFTHRAFTKPPGYAGDAVMMDYIYGLETPSVDPVVRPVTSYTTDTGVAAYGIRYRRQVLADAIDREVALRGRVVEVTALAGGHARELSCAASAQQGLTP